MKIMDYFKQAKKNSKMLYSFNTKHIYVCQKTPSPHPWRGSGIEPLGSVAMVSQNE